METEKLVFKDIKKILKRDEMKKIMGGSGSGCANECSGDSRVCPGGQYCREVACGGQTIYWMCY